MLFHMDSQAGGMYWPLMMPKSHLHLTCRYLTLSSPRLRTGETPHETGSSRASLFYTCLTFFFTYFSFSEREGVKITCLSLVKKPVKFTEPVFTGPIHC